MWVMYTYVCPNFCNLFGIKAQPYTVQCITQYWIITTSLHQTVEGRLTGDMDVEDDDNYFADVAVDGEVEQASGDEEFELGQGKKRKSNEMKTMMLLTKCQVWTPRAT